MPHTRYDSIAGVQVSAFSHDTIMPLAVSRWTRGQRFHCETASGMAAQLAITLPLLHSILSYNVEPAAHVKGIAAAEMPRLHTL
jgi:hypothetical protein